MEEDKIQKLIAAQLVKKWLSLGGIRRLLPYSLEPTIFIEITF